MTNNIKTTLKPLEGKALRIRGIILPAGWDAEGNVTAVSLCTSEEEEYLVRTNMKIGELLRFLRKDVEVAGYVEKVGKKKYITIETFIVEAAG